MLDYKKNIIDKENDIQQLRNEIQVRTNNFD